MASKIQPSPGTFSAACTSSQKIKRPAFATTSFAPIGFSTQSCHSWKKRCELCGAMNFRLVPHNHAYHVHSQFETYSADCLVLGIGILDLHQARVRQLSRN